MATDYKQQAQQQYDPTYNAKVEALKNQLAQNQQNLDQQKGGINSNYDQQVGNANLNNKLNKNNTSNAMLGRGLANSSIAVSGLAEQDAKNSRVVGQIEQGRTNDLNNIEQQKALLAQNMNNTLGQMAIDREDEINNLAMQLEDRQWEKDFKNQGLELQKQAQAYEQQYKDAMLKMQEEKQKFDMGYQNKYLEMQQQAQVAEQNYKNAMLQMQREQMASDNAYKQAQLAQSSKADNSGLNSLIDSYTAITADKSLSQNEKYKMLQSLYTQAEMYGSVNGVDTSTIKNQIYSYGKQNPYINPSATQSSSSSSSSTKKQYSGLTGMIQKLFN